MALKLYFDSMSQPCRSLMIFIKMANIECVHKLVDIAKGMCVYIASYPVISQEILICNHDIFQRDKFSWGFHFVAKIAAKYAKIPAKVLNEKIH